MEKHIFTLAIPSIAQSVVTHGRIPVGKLLASTPGMTKINCYYQNIASGTKEDSYGIANASITNQSPTQFGFLDMNDDLLTEGPDPTSSDIGRAQGLFGSADLNTVGFLLEFNIYFTSGPYNGGTLNIAGRDSPFLSNRELSVTGGTRYSRLATGFATFSMVSGGNSAMNATFQFNITVFHPIL